MDILQKAKRVNAAYETVYGPDNLLNAPITRDLAANHVIERRSQFPAIATSEYFNAPQYNILHTNINLTRGIDLGAEKILGQELCQVILRYNQVLVFLKMNKIILQIG